MKLTASFLCANNDIRENELALITELTLQIDNFKRKLEALLLYRALSHARTSIPIRNSKFVIASYCTETISYLIEPPGA